jgi:hypothetical protein
MVPRRFENEACPPLCAERAANAALKEQLTNGICCVDERKKRKWLRFEVDIRGDKFPNLPIMRNLATLPALTLPTE